MSTAPFTGPKATTITHDLDAIRAAVLRLAAMAERVNDNDLQLLADLATQAEGVRVAALRARVAVVQRGAG